MKRDILKRFLKLVKSKKNPMNELEESLMRSKIFQIDEENRRVKNEME